MYKTWSFCTQLEIAWCGMRAAGCRPLN